jgi:hypothetical protein
MMISNMRILRGARKDARRIRGEIPAHARMPGASRPVDDTYSS